MKVKLALCTPEQRRVFRLMYDHENRYENPVDAIPRSGLKWAMQQIERTIFENSDKK